MALAPGARLAALVGEDVVEVGDLAEAVAPLGERVRHPPEPPLAGVEGALPRVHRSGIAVGHDHLAHRGAKEHGAHTATVLVADGVEDQSLQRVHDDPQRPPLPAHQVPLDLETGTLGLADDEGPQVGAQRPVVLGVVAPPLGRDRDHTQVDDLEHDAASHVDEGHQPLQRAGVPVVVGRVAQVGQGPGDAPVLLVVQREIAGRPRIDLDQRLVDDPPPVQGGVPGRIVPQGGQHGDGLLHLQGGSGLGHLDPAVHGAAGDRHGRLDHLGFGPLQQHQSQPAVEDHLFAPVMGMHQRLGRVAQPDIGEADMLGGDRHQAALEDDASSRSDLRRVDGGQRVAGRGGHAPFMIRTGGRYP